MRHYLRALTATSKKQYKLAQEYYEQLIEKDAMCKEVSEKDAV